MQLDATRTFDDASRGADPPTHGTETRRPAARQQQADALMVTRHSAINVSV